MGNTGGSGPRKGGHNSGRIYNSQGKVHKGYYHNWKGLSEEDRKTIIKERRKKGSKSSHTSSNKDVADTKRQIYGLSSILTEMKACIATFSGTPQGANYS